WVKPALACAPFSGSNRKFRESYAARLCRVADLLPDFIRNESKVAPPRLNETLEASRLLANPSDLLLVAVNRLRLRDLDPPAASLLFPQLRDDSESNERVVKILRKSL